MSTIILEAETRNDIGKGASRRLRREENKVPAIIYGGDKEPQSIHLLHNKVLKALETESIFSSVFELKIDGKKEKVILKDLQRHPYKPIIQHMDLQRVSAKDVLVKMVPIHFINEDKAKGVKAGGLVSHTMNQVEVRCQAKDLPEYIEVDLADMEMDDVIHLSNLKLPKAVQLSIDPTEGGHDHAVVSIHEPRVEREPSPEEETQEAEAAPESESDEVQPAGEESEASGEEKPE
ncbi:50S ribosomal protein L25/general stress protein Ctc [Legionella yabuuchiae]|uniref:50S ribosomal protein L25/general stress protein Ctc n=1 Tax=Legionella yabuuchiae TaxID=376727 RepID=UPI0010552CFC|nr:50S ribosomal protein L25/general stress protein Ctc [Legionella yabuuchiae]